MSVTETASGAASRSGWLPTRLLSDARLARLAGRGEQRAFEAIFERYHQELYGYCRSILGDPHEAQDALQNTMTSAIRALPGDDRRIALRPWLYRVAHNEAISILRHRAGTADPEPLPERPVPGADLEAEARERLRDLVADLDELPERQRGALVMRELSGLSYAEIGAALAASEAAARQTVYEARQALRDLGVGREMECDTAQRALSERDGRVLRGRRLRAHLRVCEPCRTFGAAISQRRADLRALCPPLPAIAASGLLTSVLGGAGSGGGVGAAGGAAAGGTAGLAGGTGITGSIAAKGASVAAAVVIGAGAADMSGVVKVPLVGGWPAPAPRHLAAPSTRDATHPGEASTGAQLRAPGAGSRATTHAPSGPPPRHPRAGRAGSPQRGHAGARGGDPATRRSQAPAPAGSLPETSNGTPPAHSSAGGSSHGNPHSATRGSHGKPASPRGLQNAAAHAPTPPAHAQGKPGAPPGHTSSGRATSASTPGHGGSSPGKSRPSTTLGPSAANGSSAAHRASS